MGCPCLCFCLCAFFGAYACRVPGFFFPKSGPVRRALVGPLVSWSPGPPVPGPLVPFASVLHQAIKKLQCARSCFACALLNGAVQALRSGYVWGGGGGGRGRQSCTAVDVVVVAAAVVVVGSSSCRCQA